MIIILKIGQKVRISSQIGALYLNEQTRDKYKITKDMIKYQNKYTNVRNKFGVDKYYLGIDNCKNFWDERLLEVE